MNDLDFLAALRSGLAEPSGARLAADRTRLTAAIAARAGDAPVRPRAAATGRPAHPRPRLRRHRAGLVLTTSAAAVATAAALLVGHGGAPRPAVSVRPPAVESGSIQLTARVLRTAASVVGVDRAAEPAGGQWFFSKTVDYEYGQSPATNTNLEWSTFDGGKSAYYQSGQLIMHYSPFPAPVGRGTALDRYESNSTAQTAYRALASLPADPRALLAVIAAEATKIGVANTVSPIEQYAPASRSQVEFDLLVQLMWNAADGEPPAAEASIYRALAELPGVSVAQDVIDAAGQPTIAVSDDGGIEELLLSPQTYAPVGIRVLSAGSSPVKTLTGGSTAWPARGTVTESLAIAQLAAVRGPGVR